jgi:hypothetical protein
VWGSAGRAVSVACVGAVAVLVIAIAPGSASADRREADPLSLGAIPPRPASGPVRDRVIEGEPPALRRAAVSSGAGVYQDQDGHSVRVRVSAAYADPEVRAQELVNFLGTLLHGDEMNDLTVTLATPGEIRVLCGLGAIACYYPDAEQMVVSGEDGAPDQPPREFVIAHEYGHHLAANRSNKPWRALERGTKRWSTYEGICRGIKRRKIRPGRYFENPGEAFAEAFAFYHFPNVISWVWDIAQPNQGSFDAIFADVQFPWKKRTSVRWSGRRVKLDGPRRADFDVNLLATHKRRRVLRHTVSPSSDESLRFTVCGRRAVRVEVHRFKGAGHFDVRAARP